MRSPRKIVVYPSGSLVFIGVQYKRRDEPLGDEHRPREAIRIAFRKFKAALKAMIRYEKVEKPTIILVP